jgi:branched-chain amino acid transport system permease protein
MALGDILQFVFSGIMIGAIYSLIAVGLCIVYNTSEVINFAQGEFAMIGGMVAAVMLREWGLSLPVVLLICLAVSTAIGVVCERLTITPLKNPTILRLIIITLGLGISLKAGVMMIWGKFSLTIPSFTEGPPVSLWGATIVRQAFWIVGFAVIMMAGMRIFFERTLTGKAMRAVAEDAVAASLLGIPKKAMVMLAFALSSFIGALAGIVITPVSLTSFDHGTSLGLKGFCAAILGGMGNIYGSFLGGIILGVLESVGAGMVSSAYKESFAFLILLLILFLKPEGLFGKK